MFARTVAFSSLALLALSACSAPEVVIVQDNVTVVEEVHAETSEVPTTEVIRVELEDDVVNPEVIRTEADISGIDLVRIVRLELDGDYNVIVDGEEESDTGEGNSSGIDESFEEDNYTTVASVTVSDDTSYVAGKFSYTLSLGSEEEDEMPTAQAEDGFVATLGSDGAVENVVTFSSEHYDEVSQMVTVDDGSVIVLGSFQSSMIVNGSALVSSGESDAFVARVVQGEVDWVTQLGTPGYDSFSDAELVDSTLIVAGSVDGGANNDDGVVCTLSVHTGDFDCIRVETSEVDRFTAISSVSGETVVVEVESTDTLGERSTSEITLEIPQ